MTHKELHDQHNRILAKAGMQRNDEDMVRDLVNTLLMALYKPILCDAAIIRADESRMQELGVASNEPLNAADLSCADVKEYKDGSFEVTIEEASPDACPTLCQYIERYMDSWGWKVTVRTEW